jgi:hypothetical protein
MKNQTGKLVSVTLPQASYKALSDYSKERGMSVRRMHDQLIREAVKRNLWDDMILSSARGRVSKETEDIYESLTKDFEKEDEDSRRHCYTGMVADYHREISPVFVPEVLPLEKDVDITEKDITDLLGEEF